MKSSKVYHMSDKEFEAYLADNPDVIILQTMPLSMGMQDLKENPTRNKWGNIPTEVDGYKFPSLLEAGRYEVLKDWDEKGIITELSVQYDDKPKHTWVLLDGFTKHNGRKQRAINYVDDFQYRQVQSGLFIVEDMKGALNPLFKQKEKMFRMRYPDVHFFVNHSKLGWYVPEERNAKTNNQPTRLTSRHFKS